MLGVPIVPQAISVDQEHQFVQAVLREKTAPILLRMSQASPTALLGHIAQKVLGTALHVHLGITAARELLPALYARLERTARIQL